MQVQPLNAEQQRATGFSHKIRLTWEDMTETATNTAQTIALLAVAAGAIADRAAMVLVTPFKNSADAAFNTNTLLVGDDGDTDRFLRSNTAGTGLELNENGTEVLYHINPVAASTSGLQSAPFMYTTANTIDAVIGSMAAKSLSDLDTGIVDIYLRVVDLLALSPLES